MDILPEEYAPSDGRALKPLEIFEEALWLLLFAGTALFIFPAAFESYEAPKFVWAQTLIVFLGLTNVLLILAGRSFRLGLSPVLGALLVFALWHGVSILWAESRSLAMDETGFWLLLALAGLLFHNAYWKRTRRLRRLALGLLTAAFVTAVWTLVEDCVAAFWPERAWLGDRLGDWRGRIAAGFGNTGHIADFLALTYPLAFLCFMRARRLPGKAVCLVVLCVLYAALIAAFSTHSNAGLILAILLTLLLLWRRHGWRWFRRRAGRLSILILCWLSIALFYSLNVPGNPHRPGIFNQALSSERLKFGWPSRVFIWATGLEMVREHPWLGVGAGNFVYAFPATHSEWVLNDPVMWQFAGSWTNAAHNALLQAWAEMGAPGLALLLAMAVLMFHALASGLRTERNFEAHGRIAALAALTAYCVHAQMNFPLQMPFAMLALVLLAGLADVLRWAELRERFPDFCLEYPWGRFCVELKSMTRPSAIRVEPRAMPRAMAIVALALCVPLAGWQLYGAGRQLASGAAYSRAARDRDMAFALSARRGMNNPQAQQAFEDAGAQFQRALKLWPKHQDARSAYSELLVRWGKGREALEQLELVMQRLNAWELDYRRGRALWLLGKREEARRAIAKAFETKPIEAQASPARQALAAWARGDYPTTDAIGLCLEIPPDAALPPVD